MSDQVSIFLWTQNISIGKWSLGINTLLRMEKLVSCDNNSFSLGFVQMRQFRRTSLYPKINCVVHSLTATSVLINYPFAWRNVWIGRLGQGCLKHCHRFWYVISWKLESLQAQELHDAWEEHGKVLLRSC